MNKEKLIELNNYLEDIQLSISKAQKHIGSLLSDNSCKHKVGGYMQKRPLKVTNQKTGETTIFDSLRKTSQFLGLGHNGSRLSHDLKKSKKVVIDNYVVEPYNKNKEIQLP